MWDLLGYDFMHRALIAAAFTGLAAPAVGTYLVQRRLALLGDGLGHVAVTGVAIGLATSTTPTVTAVVVAILGALLVEMIREFGRTGGDVALALLFYGGLAAGVLITGLAGKSAARLQEYLFGSITTLTDADVWAAVILSTGLLAIGLGLLPQLFAVSQDQDYAQVAGLNVRFYNALIAVLAAVTVTVAMRTVGLLLVSALMVIPVATSQQLTRSFRSTLVSAMGLGLAAATGGLLLSAYLSLRATVAPGPTIVLLALAGFVLTWPLGAWLRHRRRARAPFPDLGRLDHDPAGPHPHQHGAGCGHPAVRHGDHVDYVHDGHRHAAHGSHYDEH